MADANNEKERAVIPPLDIEAIKEAVRKRHLMRLDDSDPVLAVATMVEVVTEQTAARFTAALSAALDQSIQVATERAEAIVNKGADHVAEHGAKVVSDEIGNAARGLRDVIAEALQVQKDLAASVDPAAAQARIYMIWSGWGAFVSILLGGLFTGLILGKFL